MKKLNNGCCATCGSANLTLAQDSTEYAPVEFINGVWVTEPKHETESLEKAFRLFCGECGEYHQVPRSLVSKPQHTPGPWQYVQSPEGAAAPDLLEAAQEWLADEIDDGAYADKLRAIVARAWWRSA